MKPTRDSRPEISRPEISRPDIADETSLDSPPSPRQSPCPSRERAARETYCMAGDCQGRRDRTPNLRRAHGESSAGRTYYIRPGRNECCSAAGGTRTFLGVQNVQAKGRGLYGHHDTSSASIKATVLPRTLVMTQLLCFK